MKRQDEIENMCNILKEYWLTYPELRLGQLLINLAKKDDIFYITDTFFKTKIQDKLKEKK